MRLRRAAGWLGGLVRDLGPAGGGMLPRPASDGWRSAASGGTSRAFGRGWAAWPYATVGVVAVSLAVGVVAVVLGAVAGGQVADATPGSSVLLPIAIGSAQAMPLALALVRPMAAFWVSVVVGVLVSETVRAGGPGPVWAEPSLLAHLGVLAIVGLWVRPRVLPVLWLVTLLAGAILVQRMPGMNASPDLVEMTTLSAVVLVASGALRGRREALRRLADQERVSHAERLHRSVLEERARIARELHDVVAHHMSLIAVQAEAAPYRVADPPPELARSFTTIRVNAVAAMTELRRVLGLLRDPADAPAGEAPQPCLADLAGLVAAVRSAGVAAELSVTGDARVLDPGVELSGYRIVQEALSNSVRHAPDASVRVEVGYDSRALTLYVVNSAPPKGTPPTNGAGHGLVGMRERVAMLGGELTVGPRDDGGYSVRAVLPALDGAG